MADGFEETDYMGIPYRAIRTERKDDSGIVWKIEYKQAKNYDWGPRGIMHERDGKFHVGGKVFDTPYEALRYRAQYM